MSFCDIHGNRFNLGDSTTSFSLQSTSKPLSYCLARELEMQNGGTPVHEHVGYEPSGRAFNEFVLNRENLPHNPLINAGAIMVSSLIQPKLEAAARFDTLKHYIHRMGGNLPGIGFDNSIFLSEKHHADRNISLAYYMRENNAYAGYPTPSELDDHMDLYFQTCAITVNTEISAVIAATLSNHGTCPITGEEVVDPFITRDCLSIMYMCGMYDFSGQFAFEFGLPAKSGVSGCLLLCIPNVGGICIWSPRLDSIGNTVRGVQFCREFNQRSKSKYHIFNSMLAQRERTSKDHMVPLDVIVQRCIKCASLNLREELEDIIRHNMIYHRQDDESDDALVRRILSMGDYDRRTPLHLAAAEGHSKIVEFLLLVGVPCNPKDRWGNTPLHEAIKQLQDPGEAGGGSAHGTSGPSSLAGDGVNVDGLMRVVAILDDELRRLGIHATHESLNPKSSYQQRHEEEFANSLALSAAPTPMPNANTHPDTGTNLDSTSPLQGSLQIPQMVSASPNAQQSPLMNSTSNPSSVVNADGSATKIRSPSITNRSPKVLTPSFLSS